MDRVGDRFLQRQPLSFLVRLSKSSFATRGSVEDQLHRQGLGHAGLPDEVRTPDYGHYGAVYKQPGMSMIYHAPFPDADATIYAVLVDLPEAGNGGRPLAACIAVKSRLVRA